MTQNEFIFDTRFVYKKNFYKKWASKTQKPWENVKIISSSLKCLSCAIFKNADFSQIIMKTIFIVSVNPN